MRFSGLPHAGRIAGIGAVMRPLEGMPGELEHCGAVLRREATQAAAHGEPSGRS